MKHIKKINEFNRTIGFRYSKPENKFQATLYCFGELDKESLSKLLDYLDIPNENHSVKNHSEIIPTEHGDVESNLLIKFDFAVYSEQEIEKIINDIIIGLNREFDVETIYQMVKELPRLK